MGNKNYKSMTWSGLQMTMKVLISWQSKVAGREFLAIVRIEALILEIEGVWKIETIWEWDQSESDEKGNRLVSEQN